MISHDFIYTITYSNVFINVVCEAQARENLLFFILLKKVHIQNKLEITQTIVILI